MEKRTNRGGVQARGVRESSLYVVAYDIPNDKRRSQVHKTLKGFGTWTEYSLFECFLTKKEHLQMHARLNKHLDAREDRIRIYRICDICITKIETVGIAKPMEEKMYLI